jgi:hypothetical protein
MACCRHTPGTQRPSEICSYCFGQMAREAVRRPVHVRRVSRPGPGCGHSAAPAASDAFAVAVVRRTGARRLGPARPNGQQKNEARIATRQHRVRAGVSRQAGQGCPATPSADRTSARGESDAQALAWLPPKPAKRSACAVAIAVPLPERLCRQHQAATEGRRNQRPSHRLTPTGCQAQRPNRRAQPGSQRCSAASGPGYRGKRDRDAPRPRVRTGRPPGGRAMPRPWRGSFRSQPNAALVLLLLRGCRPSATATARRRPQRTNRAMLSTWAVCGNMSITPASTSLKPRSLTRKPASRASEPGWQLT